MRERVREGKSPPPSIFFLPGWPFGTYARRAMKGGGEFQESPTKIEKGQRRGKTTLSLYENGGNPYESAKRTKRDHE